jgi:hypothetical protein
MRTGEEIQTLINEWSRAEILKDTLRAALLRDKLESALADTIPQGAEFMVPYLKYVDDGGSLTYNQYIQNLANKTNPISTADSPEPC